MSNPRNAGGARLLDLSQNFLADAARADAYARLLEDLFTYAPPRPAVPDPPWDVLAYFDADGSCVAGVEIGELKLMLDGVESAAMAIRLAGVTPSYRGQGLFRTLMESAMRTCGRRAAAPILLYTEDAALYTRFGFVPLQQHAFVGAPPATEELAAARRLDRAEAGTVIDRLAAARAPVSQLCAVRGASDLLRASLDDGDLRLAVLESLDALLIYEPDGDELVIVDIVASRIPTMAAMVGALAPGARRVRTLFPPDQLAWEGVPVRDDTGLMIRGEVPPAMRRPFMLPPTTSF